MYSSGRLVATVMFAEQLNAGSTPRQRRDTATWVPFPRPGVRTAFDSWSRDGRVDVTRESEKERVKKMRRVSPVDSFVERERQGLVGRPEACEV